MTGYDDLTWTTLSLVKRHLYRRLATPLNQALGRLAIARHITDPDEMRSQVIRAEQSLEIALNLLKAWAVLIHLKSGGVIRQDQRRPIAPDGLPAWLVEHLSGQSSFHAGQTRPVFVQAETLFESLVLLSLVGSRVGTLKKLVISDALDDEQRVTVRAIFDPPSTGPYASLGALYKRFSTEHETGFQLQVLQELFRLNGATLRLQNNLRSGEQALAARLWVMAFTVEKETPGERSAAQVQAGAPAGEAQESVLAELLRSVPEQFVSIPAERTESAPEHASPVSITEPPIDPDSDTIEFTTLSFHERLALLLNAPDADPNAENDSDTVIIHPQSFRERLAELTSSLAGPESKPTTDPFDSPPEPGLIERVEPENASDTLIVPPPDYQRRTGSPRAASPPESPSTPPGQAASD